MALLVQKFCWEFFLSEFFSGYFKTKKSRGTKKKELFLRLPIVKQDQCTIYNVLFYLLAHVFIYEMNLLFSYITLISNIDFLPNVTYIRYGKSEIDSNVHKCELGNLISLRHLLSLDPAFVNLIFFLKLIPDFLRAQYILSCHLI